MKKLALLLLFTVSAFAAESAPVVTVDLYGNVFLDGANTNSQIGDFARNNPTLAPQVDGAIRQLVIDSRAKIAADIKVASDAAAAEVATAKKASTDAIAAHTESKAKEIADLKAEVAALKAEIAALKQPPKSEEPAALAK
jgi:hypothetical protein